MNSGSRNQVSPGARIRWIVTMKFRPVRIDEKPVMKIPSAAGITLLVDETVPPEVRGHQLGLHRRQAKQRRHLAPQLAGDRLGIRVLCFAAPPWRGMDDHPPNRQIRF